MASVGPAGQAARLTVAPVDALLDERLQISLEGVAPGQDVTLRVEGQGGVWRSSDVFRSDARGRVEVADPMRLVWSATGERPTAGPPPSPDPRWTFTAEVDGRVIATQAIVRRAVAADVRVTPVRERGLVGTLYMPSGAGPHPAMIVLPGSQGGLPAPNGHAGGLSSRGYVVLALAFFNAEGLPPLLQNIPLEYFATAVEWLKAQPGVDSTRIGVLGTSRGGELALLLGATYPSAFRVVVANVPSHVVWPGLSDDSDTPAWTLHAQPVAGVQTRFTEADRALSSRDRFLTRLQDPTVVARAEIPVERIGGAVLLFAGKDDQLWPSDLSCARIVERLHAHRFAHPVEHHTFEEAGHMLARPFVPTSDVRQVRVHPVSKRPIMMGGTPEGQARANEASWAALLTFLERHLKRPQTR
jgi:dienelactone hydrolase